MTTPNTTLRALRDLARGAVLAGAWLLAGPNAFAANCPALLDREMPRLQWNWRAAAAPHLSGTSTST